MREKKKACHRLFLKYAVRIIPFSMIMALLLAVGDPVQAAFVDNGSLAGMRPEEAASDGSAWDQILKKLPDIDLPEINLPDIDFSGFDRETEKEKLREAVRTMDEMGLSPEKLAQRVWEFLSRKENKEKIDQAAREISEKVQNAAEKSSDNEVVKKVTEETGKAADKVTKEVADRAAEKISEEAGKAADKVTKELTDQAADRVTEGITDQISDKAAK